VLGVYLQNGVLPLAVSVRRWVNHRRAFVPIQRVIPPRHVDKQRMRSRAMA
jgi:hypothetical protein